MSGQLFDNAKINQEKLTFDIELHHAGRAMKVPLPLRGVFLLRSPSIYSSPTSHISRVQEAFQNSTLYPMSTSGFLSPHPYYIYVSVYLGFAVVRNELKWSGVEADINWSWQTKPSLECSFLLPSSQSISFNSFHHKTTGRAFTFIFSGKSVDESVTLYLFFTMYVPILHSYSTE